MHNQLRYAGLLWTLPTPHKLLAVGRDCDLSHLVSYSSLKLQIVISLTGVALQEMGLGGNFSVAILPWPAQGQNVSAI